MDRDPRLRDGPSGRPRGVRCRQREVHRLGLRHGTSARGAQPLGHPRHSAAVRRRRPLSGAIGAMNVSYAWLKTFVDFDLEPTALRDLLTRRVVTVDEVLPLRPDLEPIVIGRVVECARHPDSDRLSVTRVDAGTGELIDVVCGAPNVRAGRIYPFAPVGTTMPNGMKIERRKIRGAVSAGMLCSARE